MDIIKSIFDNLLSIKDYGFTKKEMKSIAPNIIGELLDKIAEKPGIK